MKSGKAYGTNDKRTNPYRNHGEGGGGGWTRVDTSPVNIQIWLRRDCPDCNSGEVHSRSIDELPDYPESLDTCAEFEKSLTEAERSVYAEIICAILKSEVVNWGWYPGEIEWNSISQMVIATPLQRCEAYLRLHSLWKD